MDTQDPNLILAAGGGLNHLTTPVEGQAQMLGLQQSRQLLAQGAQDLQLGGEKLQAARYGNQETALQLQEQQALMQGTRDTLARRAGLSPAPASSPSTPPPAAPFMRTPEGLIVRDPDAGRPAQPSDQILPGIVGVAPNRPPTPAPASSQASNSQPSATPNDPRSVFEETLDNLQGKVRPSTLMTWQNQGLAMKEKMANIDKTTQDARESAEKVRDAHNDALAALMKTVQDDNYSQTSMKGALSYMQSHGFEDEANQLGPLVAANPDNLKAIVDPILSQASAARVTSIARKISADSGAQKQANEAPKQLADAAQATRVDTAQQLLSAPDAGTYYSMIAKVPRDQRALLPDFEDPNRSDLLRQYAMTPEQQSTAAHQQATLDETSRHNVSDESARRLSNAISAGHLAQTQLVNGLKYGPGTQEYWVKQLAENPDSIKEMPPELRSSVGQAFKQTTGLPLPTPLSSTTQQQETAARNALDNAAFVQNALKNPEIRNNIGPIMGRLGNAEQSLGTAPNLSPEATRLAQELRTRMRYLVFSEGKAVLGGRMPQELMQQLESSSPNVRMSPAMLAGALSGVSENARSVMDNADKQRFGGQMRSREMRGLAPPAGGNAGSPPLPASLSQTDKGKIFTNRAGQKIRIVDVNPANPKQFKFEAVP